MLQGGYPGVYVREIPSGIRTVSAAPTSVLAAVGQTARGPLNEAVRVNSWGDVERIFGGLDRRFEMTYALQEFFLQGGSTGFVVRTAVTSGTLELTTTEDAFTLTALEVGEGGDDIRYGISHNEDGTFDLVISPGAGEDTIRHRNLSHESGSAGNAAARLAAPEGAGGSTLVALSGLTHRPAVTEDFDPDTPDRNDMVALAGGVNPDAGAGTLGTASSVAVPSVDLPALYLQAMDGSEGALPITVQVSSANSDAGTFDLEIDIDGGTDSENLSVSIDPTDTQYVVSAVADRFGDQVRVLTNRGPIRVPEDTASAQSLPDGGADLPTAGTTLRTSGNTVALAVRAANPGSWGNGLRVGISAADGGGFDLLVAEYRGSKRLQAEVFRGLNTISGDPKNAADVVNAGSKLLRVTTVNAAPAESLAGISVDDLEWSAMTALSGGDDGVLPGEPAWAANALAAFTGSEADRTGMFALDGIDPDVFNLMIVPEATMMADQGIAMYSAAAAYCADNLAFLLVDHPDGADGATDILGWDISAMLGSDLARNAALCFPRVVKADPLSGGRNRAFTASGSLAGVFARTDAQRGVWKAPAGTDASVAGTLPSVNLTDLEQGRLNQRGLNAMRAFPNIGNVNWGARTLAGADALASEWKYVPVRRLALFLERSLKTSLAWAVFEPNDEALWAQIRLNIGAFMQDLFVRGAFAGGTPSEAYLVKCDQETTSQQDVNSGIVNIVVGFQPLKPAEFVVLNLTQLAGRLAA